jgi:IS4 transposase
VDFALFNIPGIATLMPVDNERKHGGVAEPLRRAAWQGIQEEERKRLDQLKALRFD